MTIACDKGAKIKTTISRLTLGHAALTIAATYAACALPVHAQTKLPEVRVEDTRATPLNMDSPAESASRLGLTVRETPATVDVVDQETMKARGYRTVTEAAQGAVGVTGGDAPGAPGNFSMRGFSFGQLNTLYNGIRVGPSGMTSRMMDTGNLDRIEFLKGPASLMSGEGAAGGAINYVTRRPHSGAIENEAYLSYGSFNTVRAAFGSGGSTSIQGLDYRFDLNRSSTSGFIDNSHGENWHLSAGLDYRLSGSFKLFGAFEYKKDKVDAYWGTPLVSTSAPGIIAQGGIISGNNYVSPNSGNALGAITIDSRTLTTNYNVADNHNEASQYWLRGGFEWALNNNVTLRSQLYGFTAKREFLNSEVYMFNPGTGLVDRDRFFVNHDQNLVGNKTELQWDGKVAGMDNRMVAAFETSNINFYVNQFDFNNTPTPYPADSVTVVNPAPGAFGALITEHFTTRVGNMAFAAEDRLKITPAFALVAGLRYEEITLDRNAPDPTGSRPGYPYSQSWQPVTGRLGFTWETMPGLTVFGQYATAADVAANNLFNLRPAQSQAQNLTTARTFETGVKQLFWERKAEWSLSLFDIERKNVYVDLSGHKLAVAGKQRSKGAEIAGAVRTGRWHFWGNAAYTRAYYDEYLFDDGTGTGTLVNFSGHTPSNVPKIVANAGASFRVNLPVPFEIGASVRHVGDRFNTDLNDVTMLAYTVADAYAFIDLQKKTRLTFRVRNLTDKAYAIWADPGYPDQVLLGAPRSYEVSLAVKF